jgi:hypothetical protein
MIDAALYVLNEAVERDRRAIDLLIEHRVNCNENLAEHPDITVTGLVPVVGALGLINGILHRATGDMIAAVFDDNGILVGFAKREPQEK